MMHKYFKLVDIGGVHPGHTVQGQGNLYKSVKGGMLSSLIMILSTTYACYVLYTWSIGQILPKSQTSRLSIDYEDFTFDYNPVSFVFDTPEQFLGQVDPFQQDQIILVPVIQIVNGQTFSPPQFMVPIMEYPKIQFIHLNQSNITKNLNLVHNAHEGNQRPPYKNQTQFLLTFLKCQTYLLQQNQSCANDTIMDDFFNIPAKTIIMTVNFKEFINANSSFVGRTKDYFFVFDDSQALYTQVVMRTKTMTVSTGLLFQTSKETSFLYSVEVQTQTISKKEIIKLLHTEAYATFLIRLDSVKELELLSYPTLGEVGAQISTIVNIIFWMKMLIIFYNTKQYQSELIDVIMSQSKIHNTDTQNPDKQSDRNKELALQKTNIFNVHIELAKMRCILDQIVEKKANYLDEQKLQKSSDQENQISKTKDPDESWQNHRIKINKNNNLRKESYEVELIGTNINNRDRIKFNEKSQQKNDIDSTIRQQQILIEDLERIQQPFTYQIYQDSP